MLSGIRISGQMPSVRISSYKSNLSSTDFNPGINQIDLQERSRQVLLMREIYSHAYRVIGWLGPDDHHGSRALLTLKSLFDSISRYSNGLEWLQKSPELYQIDKRIPSENGSPLEFNNTLESLQLLLGRPFWNRIWIVQELVLPVSIWIMCGTGLMQIPNSPLFGMIQKLQEVSKSPPDFMRSHAWLQFSNINFSPLERVATLRLGYHKDGPKEYKFLDHGPQSLLFALLLTQNCEASDPRDYIYGLLGLVSIDIEPNYEAATTADVFLDVAKRCFEAGEHWILSFAGIGVKNGTPNLLTRLPVPSWVPDWRLCRHGGYRNGGWPKTHAFPSDVAPRLYITDQTTLRWPGIVWDKIILVEERSGSSITEWDLVKRIDTNNSDSWSYPVPGMSRVQACIFLLLAGIDPQREEKLHLGSTAFHNYEWQFFASMFKEFVVQMCPTALPDAPLAVCQFENFFGKDIDEFCNAMFGRKWSEFSDREPRQQDVFDTYLLGVENILRSRRFFYSQNSYMGVGPLDVQDMDLICVLQGYTLPVILRKVDSFYVYVGECDVVGIMDGEIPKAVEEGKAEVIDIVIR
jgi:Heterokaryon incompatibility protein (HET)